MERVIKSLRFLTKEEIIEFNYDLIKMFGGYFGGIDNLNNPGSLEWVLDAIQYPLFGVDNYPSVAQKAALLGWVINEGQVFHDGNKRTSILSVLIFLAINGYVLDATQDEFIAVSEQIAKCKVTNFTVDEFTSWIEERLNQNPKGS